MSFAPSYTKFSVWLWACCHLSPSFISTVFDNFENIPFLLSAALCHICLSCKLLQISAVSGSAAQGSQHSLLAMQTLPGVLCQVGKAQPWHQCFRACWAPLKQHRAALAGALRTTAPTHEACKFSFPATASLCVVFSVSCPACRGVRGALVGPVVLQQPPAPVMLSLLCRLLFVAVLASADLALDQ